MKVKKITVNETKPPKKLTRVLRGRIVKYELESNKENNPRSSARVKKTVTPRRSSQIQRPTLSRKDFSDVVEIGRGGFSVVYRAQMTARKLTCVLKSLHHAKLKKLNATVEDIELERSLCRRLNHENIPKLLGFYQTRISSVLVMEYCDKGDLFDYILHNNRAVQPFPRTPIRTQDYVRQLVTAVDYFQKTTKYIHMDIKPENVLVTSKDIVKLTDFGCCIPMKSPRHVHSENNGGTPEYRPPEMLGEEHQFDSTADVWGIGCVAFQMMARCGVHPFFYDKNGGLISDVKIAQQRMTDFKFGICTVGNFNKMDENVKTFLRQTIGSDREHRPLVSRLLETAYLTNTARIFPPPY